MKQYYFIEIFNKIVAEEYNHNRQRNLYENISSLLFYQNKLLRANGGCLDYKKR